MVWMLQQPLLSERRNLLELGLKDLGELGNPRILQLILKKYACLEDHPVQEEGDLLEVRDLSEVDHPLMKEEINLA